MAQVVGQDSTTNKHRQACFILVKTDWDAIV